MPTLRYFIGLPGRSGFGSKSTAEEVTAKCTGLSSITAIITGATSGIGEETVRVLAKRGMGRLVLPVRDLKKGEEKKALLVSEYPKTEIIIMHLDLSSLASVRSFASRFLALGLPLNLLINNAGTYCHEKQVLTEDGVEMTFAVNYLGHFLLTKLLLEKMAETAKETGIEGRIVNVSSRYHAMFNGDAIKYLDEITTKKIQYDGTEAYAFSKLAMVLHAKVLTDKIKKMKANLTANAVNPGCVKTQILRERSDKLVVDALYSVLSKIIKTVQQAAATTCYVAVHPAVAGVSGKYFADCNETTPAKRASSYHLASRFWKFSEDLSW